MIETKESLIGNTKNKQSLNGTIIPVGAEGLSAYEVYLKNGGTLSEVEWLDSLKGEQGKDGATGPQGEKGQDGYTPIRGTDYWTNEDKKEIESYIDDKLGVIENGTY
jgi:hypothetical protein